MKDRSNIHRLDLPGAPKDLQAVVAIGENTTLRGLAPHELGRLFDHMLPGRAVVRETGGQPVVRGGGLHISLSHAEGLTALAVAAVPVGIDAERIDPEFDVLEFDPDLFGMEDFRELETVKGSSRRDYFYRLWTLKEAQLKRQGRSLLCGPLPNVSGVPNASTAWITRPTGRYCIGVSWKAPVSSEPLPRLRHHIHWPVGCCLEAPKAAGKAVSECDIHN